MAFEFLTSFFCMIDKSIKKLKQSIFPPIVGLLIAFILLFYFQKLAGSLYGPTDGDDVLGNDFIITTYFITFFPALIVAGVFQYFIGIPIWELYRSGSKFIGLSLWQLIIISCVIFSVIFFLLFGDRKTVAFANPLLSVSAATFITLSYWVGNIFTLKRMA
jgi:hypothetical protein